jgi:diguanylate cyclase (GGDEF)-like protein/PAS domain S-box-containing protein
MLGYSPADLIGCTVRELTHPDDRDLTAAISARMSSGEVDDFEVEKRYLGCDGETVWARVWVSRLEDGDAALAIGHIIDITEERRAAQHLAWAASHDQLTRLPNRTSFMRELDASLADSPVGSIAVLFIDLDNFKVINDSLGHAAGDELLRGMSERLRRLMRDGDVLARFGGDEFTVTLRGVTSSELAISVAERLRQEIAQPLLLDEGGELFVSSSIGIAVSDRVGVSGDDLLRDADAAMYRAKRRGRDCVEVFAPGTRDVSVHTLRTIGELRRALERDEIVPFYQPIVHLVSGHLDGFEVLARWQHPERGLLTPDEFLPLAEEVGLVGEIGSVVLGAALGQASRWRATVPAFADISIAVNVSARQLVDGRFQQTVSEALAHSGLSADALWLEITETALMSDVKAASSALRSLRDLGLHLSVDDFGTGYSSLTYLKRFPVESIKIDRSFVHGLGIDAEDSTIVEAVVNLGHSLGLTVVAEGVETPLQLARLREMGCDRAQGFLFGRPQAAHDIEAERGGVAITPAN